jgi:hypothetical protein
MGKELGSTFGLGHMKTLTLYFNELCMTAKASPAPHDVHARKQLDTFLQTIEATIKIRSDCEIGFVDGCLDADCDGLPLLLQIKNARTKDKYRRLLPKIKRLSSQGHAWDHEILYQGRSAIGLTLADWDGVEWGNGWAVSLISGNSEWNDHTVSAHRNTFNQEEFIESACDIGHLSTAAHVELWEGAIRDWGAVIAQSGTLDMLGSHPIVMYSAPLEHNPPHVHLLESKNDHRTIAKFRIEDFVREKGEPDWDIDMKEWLQTHQPQLLRSWERCQRGGHPYKLVKSSENVK